MILDGHDNAWSAWRDAMTSSRMHHAWILAGLKGVGKGLFARAAAAELVREPGIAQPDPANHPDIIVLDHLPSNDAEEDKKAEGKPYTVKRNITIEQIRRMQARLNTRPTLGSRRVVIIDPADSLETNACNALLKSLEEPPVGTFFLLVAHRPGRLLPTIRSRCRTLRFDPLPVDAMERILRAEAPEASTATRAAALAAAEGSPGAALDFVTQDLGAVHTLMLKILSEGDSAFTLRGALADEIGGRPDRDRQVAVCDLARAVIAAQLAVGDRTRQARVIAAHGELVRLGAQLPTYNFDPALVAMEIGGLLASAAMPREAAH
ncbi:AAA family ATPase [Novosphingobium sp.]|uniref:AAA family ATPase n=1 Tax=Novosphingobium sp. TaxID=1874826 RepID=UPI0027369679|nr:AAA family ATPase [Novosphingobium sp.]MDP3905655.1 AAA family ATPase [Novosphingobium sp.]